VKLVVGLGNPGDRYVPTRHNVGFRVASALATASGITSFERRYAGLFGRGSAPALAQQPASQLGYGSEPGSESDRRARVGQGSPELAVLLPSIFMNRSGEAVAAALAEMPGLDLASDFAVVVDDLDLPFGRLRIRPCGGAGGHRGLQSLIDHLGTRDFPRLRFGIGRPAPDVDPVDYVLAPFSQDEADRLDERIAAAVAALETLLRDGVPQAMDRFNRSLDPGPPGEAKPGNSEE